jgi:hypothetical protein
MVARNSTLPVLLVTDYTNRPLRSACEELGISYLDKAGWAYLAISSPTVFIRTTGSIRSAPRVSSEVTRLNGVAVGRIVRTLLTMTPPVGVRELAKSAQVRSPGSVSKLLPTLESEGAVERDDEGRVVRVRRRELLERWTRDYGFLNGNGLVLDFLAPRGIEPILQQLTNTGGQCVTGGFAGRDYLSAGTVPVVPPSTLCLYVNDPTSLAADLKLTRVERPTSNVIMAVPRDPEMLDAPLRGKSGLPLAPLPQVLADLLTLPGRESLMAEQLMDQLADADPTWSER